MKKKSKMSEKSDLIKKIIAEHNNPTDQIDSLIKNKVCISRAEGRRIVYQLENKGDTLGFD